MIEAFIKEPAQAGFVPVVHMNHAWIALEWIFTAGIDANQVPRMRSLRAELHIVFAQRCYLVGSEEFACNRKSLLFIGAFQIHSSKHNLRPFLCSKNFQYPQTSSTLKRVV